MIPYEDLVVALQAWRVKQGLPVGQLSGQLAPPPVAAAPRTAPPAPPRTSPPPAPPRSGTPPPLEDVEDAALLEETAYENEGNDFALSFAERAEDESTAIGGQPERPSAAGEPTDPSGAPGFRTNNRNDDW